MLFLAPELRLRIEANLANGSPLYVLALEGLSIVAALREISWQLVALNQSFLDEAEYAATLVEMVRPMASSARLLPPGSDWSSHATLRLHTETRPIEDSGDTEEVVLFEFSTHDLDFSLESVSSLTLSDRAKLDAAYEEEMSILRSLSGFVGESGLLLDRLRAQMESAAILAKAHLFDGTVHRAVVALNSIFSADSEALERIEQFANWLSQLQADEERIEKLLTSATRIGAADHGRLH